MGTSRTRSTIAASAVFSVVLAALGLVMSLGAATASHLRAGQLTWQQGDGPRDVEFHVSGSARCTEYFTPCDPDPGQEFTTGAMDFGDGTSGSVTFEVVSFDAASDVVTGEAHVDHTYAARAAYTASVSDCCRLSANDGLLNNEFGPRRLETLVNLRRTTASPESLVAPIVHCAVDAVCRFTVPASDPDHQGLRWRFSTDLEASGLPGRFSQPVGASIEAATGVYRWDTTGVPLATGASTYYSTQVTVENLVGGTVVSTAAVDFLIQVGPDSTNAPPVFTSPTPADGSVIAGRAGVQLSFPLRATDPNAGDTVTVDGLGLPDGATVEGAPGNPATGTFRWVPLGEGDFRITIVAADQLGRAGLARTVTLHIAPGVTARTVTARGTVTRYSGGRPTQYAITATDSNGTAAGGTLRGSATVTAPGTRGTFTSGRIASVTWDGSTAVVTYTGTWRGATGHTLVARLTDGRPDQVKLVVRQGATERFTANGRVSSGGVSIS